jgi:hypothetical protein
MATVSWRDRLSKTIRFTDEQNYFFMAMEERVADTREKNEHVNLFAIVLQNMLHSFKCALATQ